MFSWIAIHEETASRICALPDAQKEMLATLKAMEGEGLTVVSSSDKGPQGQRFPLTEIDPFTFLASFNRGITDDNRKANWQYLKSHWGLTAAVPQDFEGIPIVHNMKSWFIPYSRSRDKEQIGLLSQLFRQAVERPFDGIDADLFDRYAQLDVVTIKKLTMGLFWARPMVFLPADKKTQAFAKHKGVKSEPEDWRSYKTWVL